jgi:NAD(P)-dependent dehydrogenase (short-subunit alcohol dehydrogenase family)
MQPIESKGEENMKVAIVTGGSNGIGKSTALELGIGKSTALELGKLGIGVVLTYHNDRSGAEEVVRDIERDHGGKAVALQLDLGRRATFGDFAQRVKRSLADVWQRETFDYLVNNGGTGGGMMFPDVTDEYFDRIFDTNFRGPFFLTQHLVRFLEDGGRIVNTASQSSRSAPPGYSAYGPSKAALSCWTRYLAKELAPRQIRVNAVSPGPVHTNFGDGAFDKHPEYIQPLAEQTALGRIGVPRDVAAVIVGLLSDDFGWVTAQDIDVSGGFLL